VALEVRLSQRTEVGELVEGFGSAQAGSSAMPHKMNPVVSEQICGLARVVRGYVMPVMDGVALWHERDLAHSSVDRVCVPDAACLTDHVLRRTSWLVESLFVDSARMASTLSTAAVASASNSALVALADAGMGYRAAWTAVRAAAAEGEPGDVAGFVARLRAATAEVAVPDEVFTRLVDRAVRHDLGAVFERVEALGSR
jgi:adenylosuccinate lyase